ncbi:MAG: redoxin domain-containing protein [Phycisphaeraceae bacterium]|nr:redoxin domain-containing protein [Phycisphaeraceae bacterium]
MKRNLSYLIVTVLAVTLMAVWLNQPRADAQPMQGQAKSSLPAAPTFTATDTHNNTVSLSDYAGQYVVLEWTNKDCPFVKKFYKPGKMQQLQKTYTDKGVVWLTVCSSAEGKQGYMTADQWNSHIAEQNSQASAVLMDTSGEIGHAYGATNTPQFVIINPDGKIIYQGAIDDNPSADSAEIDNANNYVTQVLDASLVRQTKPYGCGVKY